MHGLVFGSALLVMTVEASVFTNHHQRPPVDQWFNQYLDHFTITDNRKWKQRYLAITQFYNEGGPVFLELGGEWSISGDALPRHTVTAYAKKFHAMVFQLEHRFYGQSHPTSDVSTANLRYLSADQALADAAYFIKGMTKEHNLPQGTKWIAFGGSYSANLAAWLRDKYSHLVYAAVADSGPLLAKVNFSGFLNVVKETFAHCSPKCVSTIQEAHERVKELLKTSEGQEIINKKFLLCDPIDTSNKNDVYSLLSCLSDNFSGLVQYNGTYSITVNRACDILTNTSAGNALDRYALVNSMVEAEDGTSCTDYKYQPYIDQMKRISWDATVVRIGVRQWSYQTCTEYGYYQTSVDQSHLFYEDIPLNLFFQQCVDTFGSIFNKDLIYKGKNRTNLLYGGLDCQATRVAYIYSDSDPWHVLGIAKTQLEESPVITIKGGSHCALSSELSEYASPAVKAAWYQVQDLVEKWCNNINNNYNNNNVK